MRNQSYVQMLRESLEKKITLLHLIEEENKRQKQILLDPKATPDEFVDNIEKKGSYVAEVSSLDEGFEALFSRVQEEIEANRAAYRFEIERMQELIPDITALSARIQSQEQENYELTQKKFSSVKEQVQKIRKSQKAVTKYYRSMGRMDYKEPQFMDKHK